MISFLSRFTLMPAFNQLRAAADIYRTLFRLKGLYTLLPSARTYQLLLRAHQPVFQSQAESNDNKLTNPEQKPPVEPMELLRTIIEEIEEDETSSIPSVFMMGDDEAPFNWESSSELDLSFEEEEGGGGDNSFSVDSAILAGVRSLRSSMSSCSLETFETTQTTTSIDTYHSFDLYKESTLSAEQAAWLPLHQVGPLVEIAIYNHALSLYPSFDQEEAVKKEDTAYTSMRLEDVAGIISSSHGRSNRTATKSLRKALAGKRSFFSLF